MIKIRIIIILFTIASQNVIAQNDSRNKYSYGVWIMEYQKEWIDSENSFWLIESPNEFKSIKSEDLNISYLCRQSDFEAEHCCKDKNYDSENGLIYSGNIWEVREFFESKKTKKLKVGTKTIRIIALEQTNCKCSSDYATYCNTGFEKIATIFSYRFLKMSKKEKKNFRKNKEQLIEYFNKIY
ncbi:hypothetical protein [Psychroflexus aestuariivivens]|uniref:hypothetical protein n=1 Tax=Psychroflexus aestuariivivens TaxID=1795040 RepID=UPI000FDBE266|nr:hypothetical protein [Psychroflexus aestuariivivens]